MIVRFITMGKMFSSIIFLSLLYFGDIQAKLNATTWTKVFLPFCASSMCTKLPSLSSAYGKRNFFILFYFAQK